MTGRPAVFLDRDGTITREVGYLVRLEMLELLPGAGAAVRRINEAGMLAILVTNQSGAARGLFPIERIEEAHRRLAALLAGEGARIDAFYDCPHLPEGTVPALSYDCECRKPKPGLFVTACRDHGIDPRASYAVGDACRDLVPAAGLGARTILVRTGHGERELAVRAAWERPPDHVAADLAAAVDWILADRRGAR